VELPAGGPLAGDLHVRRDDVHAGHRMAGLGQERGGPAGAAPHVEEGGRRRDLQAVQHLGDGRPLEPALGAPAMAPPERLARLSRHHRRRPARNLGVFVALHLKDRSGRVARFVSRLRLVPVAAAAAFAVVGLPACSSQAAKPSAHVPVGWMGVLATPPVGDPDKRSLTDREVKSMASIGVETLRTPFYWRDAQPDSPSATDFAPYDRIVGTAARSKISVLPTVLGTPRWARRHRNDVASSP